jgi:predicted chitinase
MPPFKRWHLDAFDPMVDDPGFGFGTRFWDARGADGDAVPVPESKPVKPEGVIEITEADLLRLVGQKNVSSKGTQQAVFDMLTKQTPTALWFHDISKSGLRLAHFLAQCCVETGQFMALEEGFWFTSAARILEIHGKYVKAEEAPAFVPEDKATRHAPIDAALAEELKADKIKKEAVEKERAKRRQASDSENWGRPVRLANKVYANRNGNGNEASGDGYRYRGRGLIQLTGRDNYRRAGKELDLPLEAEPDRAKEPLIALQTAVWYWTANKLNDLADADDATKVSKAVNLGDPNKAGTPNHLEDRKAKTKLAKEIWVKAP